MHSSKRLGNHVVLLTPRDGWGGLLAARLPGGDAAVRAASGQHLGTPERALLQAVCDALVEADRPPYFEPQAPAVSLLWVTLIYR